MTVVVSTSSPVVSIALIDGDRLLAKASKDGDRQATGTAHALFDRLLAEANRSLQDASLFVADLGPGSFTGVKIGVTLCKSFAFALGVPCAGVSAFDLIAADTAVAVPCRRHDYFLRVPGAEPTVTTDVPNGVVGYGKAFPDPTHPDASRALGLSIEPTEPVLLVPAYIAEPSISKAKDPTIMGEGRA